MKDGLKPLDEKSSLSASKGKGFRPPPRRKQASLVGESSKGKTVVTITEKDIQSSLVDEMGVMSDGYSVEYNVSKHPPSSMEDSLSSHLEGSQTLDKKNALLGSSSGSNTKALGKKVISDSCEGLKAHKDMCSSSETVTKSCLKVSGSKKPSHSVTWADQSDGVRGDLCEVRSDDIESGLNTEDVSRLALAEACAKALSQAAEAVSSGDLDASDAAAKAGIVLLPSTHQLDEKVSEEEMSEEEEEEEATLLKWPNKPGTPDSDLFERDQSWFDETPEGFNLTNLNPTHHQINPRINQDPNLVPSRTYMYTDAAWNPSTKCAGLAWIIDDAGSSSSHSATATFVASPLTAETLALRDAMTSALHCGINALLICSDSQILINLVNSKGRHVEIAVLLKDIQFLSTLFNVVEFKFIPRLDNHRAERVAKHVLSIM
ncbi:hypothetical protein F2Q70_00018633 [Brassica cretica]|uniref:RNase H type-1 domain-containing protein n=1 Tax=Brassica cretica TaxID=69181 RepID=A0A8S9HRS3_BRACR|nr:hypothetical protein F2Q70_00018633 [Brassica cretica]